MESFLYNQFILQYGHRLPTPDDSKKFETSQFHFDNIVKMKADLGTGLYTEGSGNLANVKAATNPVYFTFRQTLQVKEDGTPTSYRRLKRGFTNNFSIGIKDGTPKSISNSQVGSISGGQYTAIPENETAVERSIFKWAEMINGGQIDRAPVTIFGSFSETVNSCTEFVPVVNLKGAIPLEARIKRNPYKGVNVAELDFVADSMSFFDASAVFEQVS